MRLIDADALMATLGITDMDCDKCAWGDKEWRCCKRGGDFEDACCAIENAPTIEPRMKGKWIAQNPLVDTEECSVCGYNILSAEMETPFCPWCGARMSEGEEDE